MARFGTLLVANRGEIAVRILRAAADAGLRTVAVYSDADRDAPHVRRADVAVRIGPPPAAESYLHIPALLEAARRTGADAVHPGYGFLSERAAFARAVTDAGLTFVGPPADVIEVMGRKDRARALAVEAGVPVVPAADLGSDSAARGADPATPADLTGEALDRIAAQVGFPLLVKAAAGGGGKGMRIVWSPDTFAEAVAAARREAAGAFGDDTLLFERYVERGRHIEVQVLADEHGHTVHLFERDCSVQRRHQKVVEEAPASTISSDVRRRVTTAAVALARQVGYVNAGTVEFLVAGDDAYFLEMNTRLQVEHPVTEFVTGLDLVQLQLRVAQGEPLPFGQDDVVVRGHAIEARVYAEDPYADFLPQAGTAELVHWPARARVDSALESGQVVGTSYDPMLAKIVVSGPDRPAARRALIQALDDSAVLGLRTNLGFLRELADSEAFRDAAVDTAWLDRHPDAFALQVPDVAWCLAAAAVAPEPASSPRHPFAVADGWRSGAEPASIAVALTCGADTRMLSVSPADGTIAGSGHAGPVRRTARSGDTVVVEADGSEEHGFVRVRGSDVLVAYQGQTWTFTRPDAFRGSRTAATATGAVTAPMPGTVLAVAVAPGDRVSRGQTLGVLEAMKMELALKAPYDGVVAEVGAEVGAQVDLGAPLFRVDAEEETA